MIVTAHQPNFLPGLSVIEKCLAADTIVWLDEVLYSPGGFTNRNRLPDGTWITVPVVSGAWTLPINRVGISEHGQWRQKMVRTIRQHYRGGWRDDICDIIERPYRLLAGLNVALLEHIFRSAHPSHVFQSHLDGGRAITAVSEHRTELLPISVRLAMMVEEVGGDTYLSGQSGRNYLDERPFRQRGITVEYWNHTGPNPCALDLLERLSVR